MSRREELKIDLRFQAEHNIIPTIQKLSARALEEIKTLEEAIMRTETHLNFWCASYNRMTDQRNKAQAEAIQRSDEVAALKERLDTEAQLVAELRDKLAVAEHQIDTLKQEKAAVVANLEQTRGAFEDAQWGRALANAAAEGLKQDLVNAHRAQIATAEEPEALRDQHRYTCETLRTMSEALDRKSARIGELERCVNEAMENVRKQKERADALEADSHLADAERRVAFWTHCYYAEVAAHAETKQHLTETRRQLTDAQLQAQMAWEAWRKLAAKCK